MLGGQSNLPGGSTTRGVVITRLAAFTTPHPINVPNIEHHNHEKPQGGINRRSDGNTRRNSQNSERRWSVTIRIPCKKAKEFSGHQNGLDNSDLGHLLGSSPLARDGRKSAQNSGAV